MEIKATIIFFIKIITLMYKTLKKLLLINKFNKEINFVLYNNYILDKINSRNWQSTE